MRKATAQFGMSGLANGGRAILHAIHCSIAQVVQPQTVIYVRHLLLLEDPRNGLKPSVCEQIDLYGVRRSPKLSRLSTTGSAMPRSGFNRSMGAGLKTD